MPEPFANVHAFFDKPEPRPMYGWWSAKMTELSGYVLYVKLGGDPANSADVVQCSSISATPEHGISWDDVEARGMVDANRYRGRVRGREEEPFRYEYEPG